MMHRLSKVEVSLAETKVSLPKGLTPWILSIKAKIGGRILQNLNSNTDGLDRYLECAEIQELPGAYLCCSFYQQDMNDAFTRMGIFMGAGRGVKEGTLQKQDDPILDRRTTPTKKNWSSMSFRPTYFKRAPIKID
jgi:hypothetical protein